MMQSNYKSKGRSKRVLMISLFITAAALLLGAVVMWLWNAILPSLLGIKFITYWQAVGLLVLCKILFGSFRPGGSSGRPSHGRAYWKDKWGTMNEEEKMKFKEEWKKRCERRKE